MWLGENQGLCGGILELHLQACSIMHSDSTKHKLFVVLKVVIPMVFMVSLAMVILILLSRGKKKTKSMFLPSFHREFPKVSFLDIVRATEGFSPSNIIGRGRYGSVYEGKLFQDGNFVAIKVFNMETRGSTKSFITECNALRGARHRNLVSILTACSSIDSSGNDVKALVYKLMPRGDLHRVLYSTQVYKESSGLIHMTVPQRLSIVVDVADALEYLHHNNQGTIVHCDMKPKNILLDENMTAHVGDFGLARFKVDSAVSPSDDLYSTSSVAINGTIGYIAPGMSNTGIKLLLACEIQSVQQVVMFRLLAMSIASELLYLKYS
ncbi:receptor kinase-like protein Xa21 [Brachypodium distachyon]|nr:receptor kinase-like protein Xa21 [Brachypodium distachyon]|eukprot:XP_024319137.1 receptor kinase-like protein Xa21 [Brachypodium distachyon]